MPFYDDYVKDNKTLKTQSFNSKLKIAVKTTKYSKLDARQILILQPLVEFFSNSRNMYILVNILNGRSIVSLRLIEYFVVNYVLKNKLRFNMLRYSNDKKYLVENLKEITNKKEEREYDNNFDNMVLVHDNYKAQLKQYNKKNFDPFCRSKRIKLFYDIENNDKVYFDTTVAQLNFFKWAIDNYIIDYIIDNLETIEEAMTTYEKNIKQEKKTRKANGDKRSKTTFVKKNKSTMKLASPRIIRFD